MASAAEKEELMQLIVESAETHETEALEFFLREHPELAQEAYDYQNVIARMESRHSGPEYGHPHADATDEDDANSQMLSTPTGPLRARSVVLESVALLAGIGLLVFDAQRGGGLPARIAEDGMNGSSGLAVAPLLALCLFSTLTLLFGINGMRSKRAVMWLSAGACLLFAALAAALAYSSGLRAIDWVL